MRAVVCLGKRCKHLCVFSVPSTFVSLSECFCNTNLFVLKANGLVMGATFETEKIVRC